MFYFVHLVKRKTWLSSVILVSCQKFKMDFWAYQQFHDFKVQPLLYIAKATWLSLLSSPYLSEQELRRPQQLCPVSNILFEFFHMRAQLYRASTLANWGSLECLISLSLTRLSFLVLIFFFVVFSYFNLSYKITEMYIK